MKVITIHQPWATLIVLSEKQFETRSWATKYRGELLIHAGKKVDIAACGQEPIRNVLHKHGYDADHLPTGSIVGISRLVGCHPTHMDHSGDAVLLQPNNAPLFWIGKDSNEFQFGYYADGRYGWELSDVRRLSKPIPAKGQQGLWNWDGPVQ